MSQLKIYGNDYPYSFEDKIDDAIRYFIKNLAMAKYRNFTDLRKVSSLMSIKIEIGIWEQLLELKIILM